jgi:hypothetical protein
LQDQLLPIGDKVLKVGDKVKTKAINGEIFYGDIISLDRYNFAIVNFNNISETRIAASQLEKGE